MPTARIYESRGLGPEKWFQRPLPPTSFFVQRVFAPRSTTFQCSCCLAADARCHFVQHITHVFVMLWEWLHALIDNIMMMLHIIWQRIHTTWLSWDKCDRYCDDEKCVVDESVNDKLTDTRCVAYATHDAIQDRMHWCVIRSSAVALGVTSITLMTWRCQRHNVCIDKSLRMLSSTSWRMMWHC